MSVVLIQSLGFKKFNKSTPVAVTFLDPLVNVKVPTIERSFAIFNSASSSRIILHSVVFEIVKSLLIKASSL